MTKLFKVLYGRFLATIIEGAYNDPRYGSNIPFLCTVITRRHPLIGMLVVRHINLAFDRGYVTLRVHLMKAVAPGTFPWRWADREEYHRRYWVKKCIALRKGDLNWGRVINLEEMGMSHMEPRHGKA